MLQFNEIRRWGTVKVDVLGKKGVIIIVILAMDRS